MDYIERGRLMNAHAELVDINNAIKVKRIKEPSKLRNETELKGFLTAFSVDQDVLSKYDVSIAMPDAKSSIGYNLVAVPKSSSGYTMAVWMESTGDAYKCEDVASAKRFSINGKCKKIGT
ncbi:prepilin-type cleavage/methylation domain-containing protein [Neisseria sp. CSL10203-ORH2]|uniref:Prepilin-type cleavage/methylation domain-containing protein n=2 Tax=Neisseria montereyensis TaxID=2973938 RepID=A0ABT2FB51_9NEIS|nr:prepilin-type cleavage/methylation domain-containing protein [Neisseria montereyensis]